MKLEVKRFQAFARSHRRNFRDDRKRSNHERFLSSLTPLYFFPHNLAFYLFLGKERAFFHSTMTICYTANTSKKTGKKTETGEQI